MVRKGRKLPSRHEKNRLSQDSFWPASLNNISATTTQHCSSKKRCGLGLPQSIHTAHGPYDRRTRRAWLGSRIVPLLTSMPSSDACSAWRIPPTMINSAGTLLRLLRLLTSLRLAPSFLLRPTGSIAFLFKRSLCLTQLGL
ncbi:hypothetical protein VTI28DRAFT_2657 [Corynascus sepedonium]